MSRASDRVAELFDRINEEMLALRIAGAQQRDELLTEAEQVVMLDVYAEFGR